MEVERGNNSESVISTPNLRFGNKFLKKIWQRPLQWCDETFEVLKVRIVFVRHGHPNYKDDCLTELGQSLLPILKQMRDWGADYLRTSKDLETCCFMMKKDPLPNNH